ncbi:siderophore-interacting protein [Shimia marina]|uniref:Vibriobactin utilization protein ViuB n=1 Tax=Shimia marina TaxID=321267 RepID=A0A0P1EKE9_9RHOB|nr:siderophore-interacting protein [Shimia marina]CUH50863.1 Vibriobactin utilization protein ViuB [Shimia marina]SFE55157.1 NADPH-dependent ferric siderophore reductase, contains FAD-binding and SIP domains [Shimia marina]
MNEQTKFPFRAETRLIGLAFPAIRALLVHEAQEHGLELPENSDARVMMVSEYGHLTFDALENGVHACVMADQTDKLFILKESLVESIEHFAPQLAESLTWSDAAQHKGHPPNFQLATVTAVTPIGKSFLRVTLSAQDLSSYAQNAIHFRIILPPKGDQAPQWPRLNDKGVTIWPKGDKALHRPVYTIRSVDTHRNELVFDVFVHEGGRTTEWAQNVTIGTQIGITGPGGGGIPDTQAITIYADETAFPATARLLEALPHSVGGRVVLQAGTQDYPLPDHPNLKVIWHSPHSDQTLPDVAIADRTSFPEHMLWFASEKEDTQKMRAFCKSQDIDVKNHYIATYWSRT